MDNKKIITLNGYAEGKNKFKEILIEKNIVVWDRNLYDKLSKAAEISGWNRIKNTNYWEFLEELKIIADQYFNYENDYLNRNINIFLNHKSPQLLILHGCNKETVKNLKEKFDIMNIHVHKINGDELLEGYDIVLDYPTEEFEDEVNSVINEMFNPEKVVILE